LGGQSRLPRPSVLVVPYGVSLQGSLVAMKSTPKPSAEITRVLKSHAEPVLAIDIDSSRSGEMRRQAGVGSLGGSVQPGNRLSGALGLPWCQSTTTDQDHRRLPDGTYQMASRGDRSSLCHTRPFGESWCSAQSSVCFQSSSRGVVLPIPHQGGTVRRPSRQAAHQAHLLRHRRRKRHPRQRMRLLIRLSRSTETARLLASNPPRSC
jgi:hypothetical protein